MGRDGFRNDFVGLRGIADALSVKGLYSDKRSKSHFELTHKFWVKGWGWGGFAEAKTGPGLGGKGGIVGY